MLFMLVLYSNTTLAIAKLHYEINGIRGDIATNVNKRFDAKLAPLKPTLDKNKIQLFADQAEHEIKLGVAPYGYFQPKIQTRLLSNGHENWTLRIHVDLGPKIRVKSLHLRILGAGSRDPAFIKLQQKFPIKENDELTTESYENAKSTLLNLGQQRGYFDGKISESRVEISQQPYGAAITLIFTTGQRYQFGCVKFITTEAVGKQLSNAYLQRFVPFKAGDDFDNELINKLQTNLASSGDFSAVVVTPQPEHAIGHTVPIDVTLTLSKSQVYNFGAGYGTDTGVRGRTNIKLRRLTENGHYLSLDAKGSGEEDQLDASLQLSYNIPGKNPATDLYKFSSEVENNDNETTGHSKNFKGNAAYITEIFGWQQNLGLTFLMERSKPVGDTVADTTTFLIPNISWLRVKSDDLLMPNNGYRINFSMRGASRSTLGSTDFFQVYLQTKWLHSFTDSFRVILRGDIGTLMVEDVEDIPLSLRFFAGGAATVRGYKYNSIGTFTNGHDIVVGSIELQHRLYKQLYLSAFYDVGNVSDSFTQNYNQGVGGGLVFRTQIGTFSLTLANALNKEGRPSLLQINMGADL